MNEIRIEFASAITCIPADEWNALMADKLGGVNPFTRHEYLAALEASNCVCSKTGWTPMHLMVLQGDRRLAVMPLYAKTHSYGEYVFDWAWAEAYERNNIEYYPKLLSAIPFTPVAGSRVGICTTLSVNETDSVWSAMVSKLSILIKRDGYSSWHCLFLPQCESTQFSNKGALARIGTQFHWKNHHYQSFDGFLASMHSRKRKTIRKERERIAQLGLNIRFINAKEVTQAQWQAFYQCYQMTYAKRSGHYGYLNLAFFKAIALSMPEQIMLLVVEANDIDSINVEESEGKNRENPLTRIIASALYFQSNTHLYGRYWGALERVEGLHFEVCYYQGIEYCIKQGLDTFDAGAQGEHKVPRGFEPIEIYSNHEIAHPAFRDAIDSFTLQECAQVRRYIQEMSKVLPFKSEG
ncbi:N-acetyltransferase [Shewanella sp. VB17]|uniref:GNAT family N-acetyltransferase n=1 Tax=Shewanella sp. VB17 TaxID=2739432 RepID=UPI001565F9D6|nr:GNAT family N-acetyltransferase [Shewanella sp. VB17]NRD73620.1 N-acetyltransferase [Shewanella sp. VB17]